MACLPINDPEHWRSRAEEARTIAEQFNDPDCRAKMLRIAAEYEEWGRRAAQRAKAGHELLPRRTRG